MEDCGCARVSEQKIDHLYRRDAMRAEKTVETEKFFCLKSFLSRMNKFLLRKAIAG